MRFLPRLEEVPGWRLEHDPLVYPNEHLHRHLSSAAAYFRSYDVLDVTVGSYRATAGNGFATIEIFRFPDFIQAFGAYSGRRKTVLAFLDLANEGFAAKHSLHLWRGPFYIRVTGGGSSPETYQTLLRSVADRMPSAAGKPAVFNFLPETGRVANSELYSAESAFGQRFLAGSFSAQYQVEGGVVDGAILPAPNRQVAEQILQRYSQFFVTNGRLLDPIPNLGESNFTAEDRLAGRAVVFRIDRFVILFRGYTSRQNLLNLAIDTDRRILGTISRQLQQAERERIRSERDGSDAAAPPPAGPLFQPPAQP